MLMLSPLMKWLGLALITLVPSGLLWLQNRSYQVEIEQLKSHLIQSQTSVDQQRSVIEQLKKHNAESTRLYAERLQREQAKRKALKAERLFYQNALADETCYQRPWPDAVIERLHQPY
ncbi:DUF2570 domain-containing protein [Vibrio penaeicida]|uniref:DUF2570 domain-containing protein n=1 Tax=Vibrio penaeicida TaxID=104609 RepID=A0AAV5NSB1_9VIBR|nr:DUF2570 domain-containing protein [Vibrio penaeicida]GLQ72902.1 hypothetical protein GCM10007932_22620 [Vibrio penaeicida]